MTTWEAPPPSRTGKNADSPDYTALARELLARPGQWAKIENARPTLTSSIKLAKILAFRPVGAFEAVARFPNGRKNPADCYVRYIGENGEYSD